MSLHPYLFFTNTTRDAMTLSHEIFGGELHIMGSADVPAGSFPHVGAPDGVTWMVSVDEAS